MQTALVNRATGLAALKSSSRVQKHASSRNLVVRAAEQEPQSSRPANDKTNFAQANVFNSGTTEKPDSYQVSLSFACLLVTQHSVSDLACITLYTLPNCC